MVVVTGGVGVLECEAAKCMRIREIINGNRGKFPWYCV